MTGYGRGTTGGEITVEVKAVNHRFLDLKIRETAGRVVTAALEEQIGARIRARIERGSLAISVHAARARGTGAFAIDADAASRAHDLLTALAARLGTPPPELALVLAQPGVIVTQEAALDDAPAHVLAALELALDELDRMRATEGAALAADLAARLAELDALRADLAAHAAGLPALLARRLSDRIAAATTGLDPQRLAQEVALLVDRADVSEELVRLASHLSQVRTLLEGKAPAGRRLDFLAQEIGRELNTIGSKSALAELTRVVVEAKAVLEKLREQIQNIE
jgi:uncharacterized protein (TIGR00255 family)